MEKSCFLSVLPEEYTSTGYLWQGNSALPDKGLVVYDTLGASPYFSVREWLLVPPRCTKYTYINPDVHFIHIG